MIYGIGTDILDIARIAGLYGRYGAALPRRLLHGSEQAAFAGAADPVRFLAKRFAAKEAFAKAVGTGVRAPVSLGAVAVAHDEAGKPYFVCREDLRLWLAERGIARVHLSLSDEREQVLAFAVAECAENG